MKPKKKLKKRFQEKETELPSATVPEPEEEQHVAISTHEQHNEQLGNTVRRTEKRMKKQTSAELCLNVVGVKKMKKAKRKDTCNEIYYYSSNKVKSLDGNKNELVQLETMELSSKKNEKRKSNLPRNTSRFTYSDREVYSQNSLKDLKELIKDYLEKGLPKSVAADIINKWKRRESRRLKRQNEKAASKICFGCRKLGHELANCPEESGGIDVSTGICFKCGSTEHTAWKCKKDCEGFPFAKCFICEEQGHLSRDCRSNPNGVYPRGGVCKQCGMRDHLIKDCPQLLRKQEAGCYVSRYSRTKHISADDEDNVLLSDDVKKHSNKEKIVRF